MFIVFDGPDGSGKTTLMKKTVEKLKKDLPNYNIVDTKEPGGTEIGRGIRDLLLNDKYSPSHKTELMLFMADRAEHYSKVLKPKLETKKNIVISDRYWESTLVYQLIEGKTEKESIEYLHRLITNDLFPDLFFIIDSKEPHSLKEDRLDQKSKVFRNQIRHSYYELAANNVYPTRLIDTTKGKWNNYLNEISQNIVSRVSINEFLDGKIA